jgi:hypothetical protein
VLENSRISAQMSTAIRKNAMMDATPERAATEAELLGSVARGNLASSKCRRLILGATPRPMATRVVGATVDAHCRSWVTPDIGRSSAVGCDARVADGDVRFPETELMNHDRGLYDL